MNISYTRILHTELKLYIIRIENVLGTLEDLQVWHTTPGQVVWLCVRRNVAGTKDPAQGRPQYVHIMECSIRNI